MNATATDRRNLAVWAIGGACACVIMLVLTWVAADLIGVVHHQDAAALEDFNRLSRPWIDAPANFLLGLLEPPLYTLWALGLVTLALLRGRARTAIAVALIAPVAPLSSELLKPLAAHPHAPVAFTTITDASWPSGHSTAAMTLALCAVLVAPRHLRPLVAALGSLFAIAVGFALLVLAWHMPSDVFAGYLVAGCWSALAVAALCFAERRRPSIDASSYERSRSAARFSEKLALAAPLALVASAAVTLALLLGSGHLAVFALDHRALVIAAGGIAALAVTICTTLSAALRG